MSDFLPSAPSSVDPQLADRMPRGETMESIVARGEFAAELKVDGWRLLFHVDGDGAVHAYTRSGKSATGKLPHVEAEIAKLPAGTWLDGEAVAFEVKGGVRHDWGRVQSILGSGRNRIAVDREKVTYVAFDLIAYNDLDARSLEYRQRRSLLVDAVRGLRYVRASEQVEPTRESYNRAIAEGYEGLVLKSLHSRYASGRRGAGWTKVKPTETLDGVVMGFTEGRDSFAGMIGAMRVGQYVDGELTEVLTAGTGMDFPTRRHMTENPDQYVGRVVEIAYAERMPTGGYRHPVFKRMRDDRVATEAVA